MNEGHLVELVRQAIIAGLVVIAPVLLAGFAVATVTGLVQAATGIHEPLVGLVPRLLAMAADLLGELSAATIEKTWAGLRPGSVDGLPSIGRAPGCDNAYVAGGHFRAGLHQSTGTAVIVADLIEGFNTSRGTLRFPVDQPLSMKLVRALVTARRDDIAARGK